MKKDEGKKIKEAVALQYSPEESAAPKIIAQGRGEAAERILETAKEHDVPVYEDAGLAQTLNQLNFGDQIPSELYEVVAEIFIFISTMDRNFGEKYGRKKRE